MAITHDDPRQALKALEAGRGPVLVHPEVAAEMARIAPELLDGGLKARRLRELGPGPYSLEQFGRYELRVIPSPDEAGAHEAKARSKHSKRLHDLAEAEARAEEAFQAADTAWTAAAAVLAKAGEVHLGLRVTELGPEYFQAHAADAAARGRLREVEREAWQSREDAAEALRRARVAHAAAVRRLEAEVRAARDLNR